MDESLREPRFRRVPRPRPRRMTEGRPRPGTQAQAQPPFEPALQPPEGARQDGDAEGGIHALLHHGMHLAEHDHVDEAMGVLIRARILAERYHLPSLEAQALYNQRMVRAQ